MGRELQYLPEAGAFRVRVDDQEFARRLRREGWGRDSGHRGPGYSLFTREPYAAVHYIGMATPEARTRLLSLYHLYEASMSLEGPASIQYESRRGDVLLPFQRAGVDWAMRTAHPLVGDDMGLGKTVQGICLANEMRARRVLVVCPGSVRLQWARQVRDWSVIPRVHAYTILKSADGVSPHAHWTIVSYDLTRKPEIHSALMRLDFDLMIVDEAHYLKTPDSGRTRACLGDLRGDLLGLATRAEKVVAMTGTPLPNRPRECYTIARHLCWDAIDWLSEERFYARFNPSAELWNGHVMEEVGRLPELRARLRCNFMVRRLFAKAQPQLPKMRCELAYLEPNGAIRKALKAERLLDVDLDDLENLDMATRGHIATVRREMGVAKVPRVVEHVNMLMDGGLEKLILIAFHRDVMAALAERLKDYGVAVVIGGQTPGRRDREVQRFVRDPACRIAVCQLQAAGVGLDEFQRVCHVGAVAEASWVWGDNDQFTRRLWRMGQEEAVLWQFLVAPGSLDEKILGRAIEKAHNVHETLDGG